MGLPNGGRLINAHPPDVPLRRFAEQTSVLTAELRGTFVSHSAPRVSGVKVLVEHQLPRFLQAQLLLILQWADTGDGAKMLPESSGAHVRTSREFVNVHCSREILLQPNHSFCDLLAWGAGGNELA